MKNYGKELILDLHECDIGKFNRRDLTRFFKLLCKRIDMVPEDLHFWDYENYDEDKETDPDHLVGTSAVQFIRTSNITIHALDKLKRVYVNVFSCKDFDGIKTVGFVKRFFSGKIVNAKIVERI